MSSLRRGALHRASAKDAFGNAGKAIRVVPSRCSAEHGVPHAVTTQRLVFRHEISDRFAELGQLQHVLSSVAADYNNISRHTCGASAVLGAC